MFTYGEDERKRKLVSFHFTLIVCFSCKCLENQLYGDSFNSCTYQDYYKDGSCEAPDECVMDREPTEIWVPISLRVKTYCQTYTHTHTSLKLSYEFLCLFPPWFSFPCHTFT